MAFLRPSLPRLACLPLAAALACTGTSGDDTGASTSSSTTDASTTSTTDATATASTASGTATAGTTAPTTSTSTATTTDGTTTAGTAASDTTPDTSTTTGTTDPGTTGTTDPDTTGTTGGGGLGFDPGDDGVQMCSDGFAQDAVQIVEAAIKGDLLFLKISYGGGCADHLFGLCWDGLFAESDPVQTWMVLGHESNDDPCDGIVMEDRTLDLTDLKQAWIDAYQQMSGTIIIHLEGYADPIEYIF